MALRRYKLGQLTEQCVDKNEDNLYGSDSVIRISVNKELAPTKANLKDVSLKNFIVVKPKSFVYAADTSRRGDKISLAYNSSSETYLASNFHIVFRLNDFGRKQLLEEYLFMYFNRSEFDRYARMHSWGSARERFYYSDMSDVEIELPPIEVQRKYVAIYEAMLANQRAYEQGLDDLKLTCDAKMNDLVQRAGREALGQFVERHDVRNADNSIKNVKSVSTQKIFREPTSKVDRNNLSNYKIVRPGWFSFVQTTHNEKCFAFAFNNTENDIVVTSVNEVFSVDADRVDPDYLSLFFNRSEFDRYARFNSWGSARETFTWADLQAVEIPFIPISEQKAIADVYRSWFARKEIDDRLKAQLKNVCPILIRGSIEEASR